MIETLQKLVDLGCNGEYVPPEKIIAELKAYETIILRGAGNFGNALGEWMTKLDELKGKLIYWDQRAEELKNIHGITVSLPNSHEYDKSTTLVINCIPGGSSLGTHINAELKEQGFKNILYGMSLFETVICPLNNETGFDSKECLEHTSCTWCNCGLLMKLLKESLHSNRNEFEDELAYQIQTFVINTKCSLKCKHCSYLLNYYAKENKVNFPLERIKEDVDKYFDAVDTVAFVSVIGGEPFLHPHLNEIIEHILTKKNFGMIGITTSGVCQITEENLRVLKNPRTRVMFSHYAHVLSEQQEKVFQNNVEKVKNAGLSYTIGEPMWYLPAKLAKQSLSDKELQKKKTNCTQLFTSKIVMNGKIYPCSTCMNADSFNVCETAPYSIDLLVDRSKHELRRRIIELTRNQAYPFCDYCYDKDSEIKLPFSGEQGNDKRYEHLINIKKKPMQREE